MILFLKMDDSTQRPSWKVHGEFESDGDGITEAEVVRIES